MFPQLLPDHAQALLALADGTVFLGRSIGAVGETTGEVVFNTALTGYQEILTDPSYCRQIVTLTYPHIGSYGTSAEDVESRRVFAAGLVVKDVPARASNFRSDASLGDYLRSAGTVGIAGIDTRRLTRHLRSGGAQNGCIVALPAGQATTPSIVDGAIAKARSAPSMSGLDLAKVVSVDEPYDWTDAVWELGLGYSAPREQRLDVVAYDFGVKFNILRMLATRGCKVTVVPAQTPAADVLARKPDGVFLANGPGDPEPCDYAIAATRLFLERGLPDLRHLPRTPDHGARRRREDVQDEVRSPRRQSPGEGARLRPRQHHEPEPWLRGRPEVAAGDDAAHARLALRRHAARAGARR